MAVRDRVGGARFHAVTAEYAAIVIDIVHFGVTLAAGNSRGCGVLGRFDINTV
jgi:hypothetical protein